MRKLSPTPRQDQRSEVCERVRIEAANLSRKRLGAAIDQKNNRESMTLNPPVMTFTKSMPHDNYGIVAGSDFEVMIGEINQEGTNGNQSPFLGTYTSMKPATFDIPLYQGDYNTIADDVVNKGPRGWESPLSGHVFELEGPDPDAVAMPPAPKLGSAELTAEMAEVYVMALCRDIPFKKIEDGSGKITLEDNNGDELTVTVSDMLAQLNKLTWNNKSSGAVGESLAATLSAREISRRNAHFETSQNTDGEIITGDQLTLKTLFRGSTVGSHIGPYISQFFLIGTPDRDEFKKSPSDPTARTAAISGAPANPPTNAQPRPARTAPPLFVRMLRSFEAAPDGATPPPANFRMAPAAAPATGSPTVAGLTAKDGFIAYGQQLINQRILPQRNRKDYLADWASWIDAQNGANLADQAGEDDFGFVDDNDKDALAPFGRFIHSPRDLATFVHFDALYQAYHNAMLIMLRQGVPTDIGLPEGSGHPTRSAFATFGDPHILTLLPEVATRALKAVRRQKFQTHLRARPEALGGVLSLASHPAEKCRLCNALGPAETMLDELNGTSLPEWTRHHNRFVNKSADVDDTMKCWISDDINLLLSQAFREGSPVHGSYGAGHATVAGACTTILKAFFEMYDIDESLTTNRGNVTLRNLIQMAPEALFNNPKDLRDFIGDYFITDDLSMPEQQCVNEEGDLATIPAQSYEGGALTEWNSSNGYAGETLTVEGELDKLAANVSIGRNFAGVHFSTDYYESLRMGERIAVGMLQEQMLTYREPVSMRFTSFDGDKVMISGSGGSRDLDDAEIHVWERGTGEKMSNIADWWNRCLQET